MHQKCCENCCELCSGTFPYCVVDGNFKEITNLNDICDNYSDCRIKGMNVGFIKENRRGRS